MGYVRGRWFCSAVGSIAVPGHKWRCYVLPGGVVGGLPRGGSRSRRGWDYGCGGGGSRGGRRSRGGTIVVACFLWRCKYGRILRGEHARTATMKEIWGWKVPGKGHGEYGKPESVAVSPGTGTGRRRRRERRGRETGHDVRACTTHAAALFTCGSMEGRARLWGPQGA